MRTFGTFTATIFEAYARYGVTSKVLSRGFEYHRSLDPELTLSSKDDRISHWSQLEGSSIDEIRDLLFREPKEMGDLVNSRRDRAADHVLVINKLLKVASVEINLT